MAENNKIAAVAVIALIIGATAGYLFGLQIGRKSGRAEADQKTKDLQDSLSVFVPPLPDVINVIGGKITAVNGNSFAMEMPSLTDRYPHPGEAMATEVKTIRMADDTEITDTSYDPKRFKNGLPQTKTILAKDLRVGDVISVTVKENARTEQNLTAIFISRSSGI